MEGDFIKVNKKLLPLSWIYGIGVGFRNFLFDIGILKSKSFTVPIISVGNITVGGTGKTPHVEYLIKLLEEVTKVAVLSRGYKRATKGYILANENTTAEEIGDEPYQMKQKFPNVTLAVDKKRARGIEQLTEDKDIGVILLDDAFQHRYVKPGINILLVDYHRLIIYDKLLPAGRLREPLSGKNRADIVIVTKCPKELKPMEFRVITKGIDLYPYQHLYFTTIDYEPLQPVFPQEATATKPLTLNNDLNDHHILLVTGIATPQQMECDLRKATNSEPATLHFSDHHKFSKKDIRKINDTFKAMPSPKLIITTEKDAARIIQAEGLDDEVRRSIFALPVHISFMLEQENNFNENIIGYVRKNSRNSILAKGKDDHKPKDSHRSGDRPRTISFRNN